jgi:hypothetical protein
MQRIGEADVVALAGIGLGREFFPAWFGGAGADQRHSGERGARSHHITTIQLDHDPLLDVLIVCYKCATATSMWRASSRPM